LDPSIELIPCQRAGSVSIFQSAVVFVFEIGRVQDFKEAALNSTG
jgi:hypothetical protein